MEQSDINLLPEQQIEALQHDKLHRQKLYYLLAIVITLIGLTVIGAFVYVLYARTVEAQRVLIQHQSERIETLNPLWNSIIVLNQNAALYPGVHSATTEIRETFNVVVDGLNAITLLEFGLAEEGVYAAEFQATSKEQAKEYVAYLRNALPEASVQQIQTIREFEGDVYFELTISYQ